MSSRPTRRGALRTTINGAGAWAAFSTLVRSARAVTTAKGVSDPVPAPRALLSRIAFGSCLKESADASILDRIVAKKPHLMLWMGDNIYADTKEPEVMREKYGLLAANPRFQRLLATCPNLATWDDHDFGADNAGSDFPMRAESRDLFFDFWKIDPRSPRRAHEGVYDAFVAGPRGREVQVILLDNRYNRSPKPYAGKGPEGGTVLGDAQWTWLEAELARRAAIRIIVSGVQVVREEVSTYREKWADFPRERQRLFDTIRSRRIPGVIFLSGDAHQAELNIQPGALGYDAIDATSSSLDQPSAMPKTRDSAPSLVGEVYTGVNFGTIDIDWGKRGANILLQIHPPDGGSSVISHLVALRQLAPSP